MDTQLYRVEDLLEMEGDYELDRGTLVEVTPPGASHGILCARIVHRLVEYANRHGGAVLGNDSGFVLRRAPDTVRGPDVAFVRPDRVGQIPDVGYLEGPPDLAVEVISPGDGPGVVNRKVGDYLAAGCPVVWVFDRRHRSVEVYGPDLPVRLLRLGDALDGGELLPGFHWPLEEIYS